MIRRLHLLAAAALLAGCTATATGSVTPGASASPGASTAPGASAAPAAATDGDNFVPTKFTLKIDGKDVAVNQKGFTTSRTATQLGASLGLNKGEKAGANEVYGPSITIVSKGKDIGAADFTKDDASISLVGLNWVRNLTARTYVPDASAVVTFKGTGGKVDVTYAGKMNRATGSGDFPEVIQVDLVVEGIPTK